MLPAYDNQLVFRQDAQGESKLQRRRSKSMGMMRMRWELNKTGLLTSQMR